VYVGSIEGYTDQVTLSASGNPAETTAIFSVNPVTPSESSILTIGDTGTAAAGTYGIDVTGTASAGTKSRTVGLNLFTDVPTQPVLLSPADGGQDVGIRPSFSWGPTEQAVSFQIEIATDPEFTSIQYSAGATEHDHMPDFPFCHGETYYWRVAANNACGRSPISQVFVFTTVAAQSCLDLEKRVSGDGGMTFFDADYCSNADVPFTRDNAVYELVVTNCGLEAVDLYRILDSEINLDLALAPIVTVPPCDSVTFTNDAGQTLGLLQKQDACPDANHEFDNLATVSGAGVSSLNPVEDSDPACVKCGPCIDLLKEVSVDGGQTWFDANTSDCTGGPATSDPVEYRLTLENCGDEAIASIVINDAVLGITNLSIDAGLESGEIILLNKEDIPQLAVVDLCPLTPGDPGVEVNFLRNIARVDAEGQNSGIPVFDEDLACVKCEAIDDDGDGIPDDQDVCPDTAIPESVPTKRLGTNRFALVDGDTIFDTKIPKGKGSRRSFTVEDTAGCSCEQIIEEMDLGKASREFGCNIGAMEEWVDRVSP
jgi:hypothetical protein